MSHRERGFTLIELLIVIAIIAAITAILVPPFGRARIQANEANAQGAMGSMLKGMSSFVVDHGDICPPFCCFIFPRPPGCNCPPPSPPPCPWLPCPPPSPVPVSYLSPKQVESLGPDKPWQGYVFRYETGVPVGDVGGARFCYQAKPQVQGSTGVRAFGTDASGAIGVSRTGADCCTGDGRLNAAACTAPN
jgi:prepilin-type N-terminal cleavage/methylation domain-containing protein